jgi:hypothetical protein
MNVQFVKTITFLIQVDYVVYVYQAANLARMPLHVIFVGWVTISIQQVFAYYVLIIALIAISMQFMVLLVVLLVKLIWR